MAETDIQSHLTKIKLELKRLLQSAVAILEKVQGQNPTSRDQLNMILDTTAESEHWDERIQTYKMNVKSSLAALGINTTNLQYKVTTKKWIDVTTGQEVVANPIMQALAESIQSEITQRFWVGPTKVLMSIYVATPDDFRTLPVDCTQAVLSLCVCVVLLPFSFLHAQQQRQRAAAYALHLPFYI